jgi:hypothetical protein
MGYVLFGLGGLLSLGSFICWIIILIDAFKNDTMKAIGCLLCDIYAIYYSFTEFDHEKQMQIAVGHLAGWLVGGLLMGLGGNLTS